MSLRKLEGEAFLTRFQEFDEARAFIEDMKKERDLTFDAIDYMIYHKEYYFLLKHLYNNFAQEGGKEIIEYVFARLDVCLNREEDRELLQKLWSAPNEHLKKELFYYVVDCANRTLLELIDTNRIDFGYFLKVGYSREIEDFLLQAFRKRLKELREILEFFALYSDAQELIKEIDALKK